MNRLLSIALLLSGGAMAQIPHDSLWAPMRYFIGSWKGTSEGQSGVGHHERNYQWALNGNFMQVRNKAAYAPQEKNPQGEIHEDVGYVSYNSVEQKFMLRQFHVEGYVNEYKLDILSADRKTFIFVSFNIENIPPGWRARETYRILNADEFEEVFELAAPGKDFTVYSRVKMKRWKPRFPG